MRSIFHRLTPTRTVIVALTLLFSVLITPHAQAASAVAYYTYTCPSPPSCTGTGCNPWHCSITQAGYYAHDIAAHLNAVVGNFITDCFSGSTVPPAYTYGAWIGIGGDNPAKPNGGNMVQTGALWNGLNYSPFYEFPGKTNGPTYDVFTIPCNTLVEAEISQNASGQFCTLVKWYPYGSLDNYPHCFPTGWLPDQTTAQWVDERQVCQPFALETTAWSNAYAYSPEKNWHTLAGWPRTASFMIDMRSPFGAILEAPNNPIPSATTFNDVSTGIVSNDTAHSNCL